VKKVVPVFLHLFVETGPKNNIMLFYFTVT